MEHPVRPTTGRVLDGVRVTEHHVDVLSRWKDSSTSARVGVASVLMPQDDVSGLRWVVTPVPHQGNIEIKVSRVMDVVHGDTVHLCNIDVCALSGCVRYDWDVNARGWYVAGSVIHSAMNSGRCMCGSWLFSAVGVPLELGYCQMASILRGCARG